LSDFEESSRVLMQGLAECRQLQAWDPDRLADIVAGL
jgi:hypothetical protein